MSSALNILLKGIRWQNLLIVVLSLSVSNFLLVRPINKALGYQLNLNFTDFVLLTLSVLFITAGGNVINDYFDVKTDHENSRFNLASEIGKTKTLLIYGFLSVTGLLYGLWLTLRIDSMQLWSIHLMASVLLLLYSGYLKSTPLAGNLIVAFLCAIVPLLPLMFENESLKLQFQPTYFILNFLALFAFISTLIRELVKDMEDLDGDEKAGKWTLPVVIGVRNSRALTIIFFSMLILLLLSVLYFMISDDIISFIYLLIGLLLPSLLLFIKLLKGKVEADYRLISSGLKGLMLIGLCYGIVYHYIYL